MQGFIENSAYSAQRATIFINFASNGMSFCLRKLRIGLKLLPAVLICAVFFTSCKSIASPTYNDANTINRFAFADVEFDLGDNDKFDFKIINFANAIDTRFLVHYEKREKGNAKHIGEFFKVSQDGGETFGEEFSIRELIPRAKKDGIVFQFFEGGLAAILSGALLEGDHRRKGIFYTRTDDTYRNWTDPAKMNTSVNSISGSCKLVHFRAKKVYCVFDDGRSGSHQLYFSRSLDGGESWSRGRAVESDFRNAAQDTTSFLVGEKGRLHLFWDDWRNEKTLLDVRYSYSDDDGETWTPSRKINDDSEYSWQGKARAVVRGDEIFVVFDDFREKGVENDKDWNIYSARSRDNGETWEKNARLNPIKKGRQLTPRLLKDSDGTLYCVWLSTENTLFGQLIFTYSKDFGHSWSPPVELTGKEKMLTGLYNLVRAGDERLVVRWEEEKYDSSKVKISRLTKTDSSLTPESNEPELPEKSDPIKYDLGKKLFEEDFQSDEAKMSWGAEEGIWSLVDGAYRGSRPAEDKPFVSTAKFGEPSSFVLKGRFKLDEVRHHLAAIYFRSNANRYYVIKNQFRNGSWLSVKDDKLPSGLHFSGGEVVLQTPFPYRSGHWYNFTLVVTPEEVDYYVNDRLMLSLKEKLILAPGKVGIGGWGGPPTYFDDIAIYELKK